MGVLKNDVGRPSNKTITIRNILKGVGILIIILIIIGIFLVKKYINSITYYIDEEDIITEQTVFSCHINEPLISGNSAAEKAKKIMSINSQWDYYSYGSITYEDLSTYEKVSIALYNLGYFNESEQKWIPEEGCYLSKKELDDKIVDLFLNSNYEAKEFLGNDCLPLSFEYDEKKSRYLVKENSGGCGDGGYFVDRIYSEKEKDGELKFKTEVITMDAHGISYLDNNNNFVEIEKNIPNGITENNVLDKYNSYTNIYEWTFKKVGNSYKFYSIEKLR